MVGRVGTESGTSDGVGENVGAEEVGWEDVSVYSIDAAQRNEMLVMMAAPGVVRLVDLGELRKKTFE